MGGPCSRPKKVVPGDAKVLQDQKIGPIDLDEIPASTTATTTTSVEDPILASTSKGIQIPLSSFRRLLGAGRWLDDLCLDFFGDFLTQDATLASGCRWISWAQMNSPHRRKISPSLLISSVPSEVVAPLNWKNQHWGLIGFSFQSGKYWFFDSMDFYLVSSFHQTRFLTCCSEIFPDRFSPRDKITLSKVGRGSQKDGWSCGIRCLYYLLTLCNPTLELPQTASVDSMREELLTRFSSSPSVRSFPALDVLYRGLLGT